MAFTKIVGAGIHTLSNVHTHNINSSGIITATNFVGIFSGTNGDFSGNVTIDGNLVVNGDTTTLNTTLREVEILRVDANNSTVGAAITQSGSGDILNLYDGSTQVFTVDDTGNVGLGSATPASLLNLASSNPLIRLTDTDNGAHSTIGGESGNLYLYTNSTARDFIFRGTGEVARLTGDGKLGIGTHTPTAPFQINNASPKIILEDNDNAADISIHNVGGAAVYSSAGDVVFQTLDTTARLRIKSTGQVTIGSIAATSSASGVLETRASNTTSPVVFGNDTENCDVVIRTTGANKHSVLGFGDGADNFIGNIDYDHQNNNMVFDTNGGERLRITSDGKVGIGTDNIDAKLKVRTAGVNQTLLTLEADLGTNNNRALYIKSPTTDSGSEPFTFHTGNSIQFMTDANIGIKIHSDGRVGVGTDSPMTVLTTYGENLGEGTATGQITAKDNAAWNASPTAGLVFQGHYHSNGAQAIFAGITGFKENGTEASYAGSLAFHVRADGDVAYEAARIKSTGEVGIGHTNPQSMLEVREKVTTQAETDRRIAGFYKYGTAVNDEGYIHLGTMVGHYGIKLGYKNEGASPNYLNQGFFISTVNGAENITNHVKRFEIKSDGVAEFFNTNSATIKLKRHASTTSQQAHIGYFSSGLHIETRENTYITLKTNTVEKVRITGDGQLCVTGTSTGVDTTPPLNGFNTYYETDQGQVTIGAYSSGGTTHMAFYTNQSGNAMTQKMCLRGDGTLGLGIDTPTAGDLATGYAGGNTPVLHVNGTSGNGAHDTGEYNLLARFQAGTDSDNTGAMIVLNHSNDRGIAIQGGRATGNNSFAALKMIDNVGRLTDIITSTGYSGQGVSNIRFFTGNSTTTTQRLHIDGGGKLIMGSGTTTNDSSERFLVDGSGSNDHCGLGVKTNNNVHDGYLAFHDTDANFRGKVSYDHQYDMMYFTTNGGSTSQIRLSIDAGGLIKTVTRGTSVRRMILSGSPSNGAFNIEAHDGASGTGNNTNQGELGLYYNDGSTLTDEATIKFYRGSGANDGHMVLTARNYEMLSIGLDHKDLVRTHRGLLIGKNRSRYSSDHGENKPSTPYYTGQGEKVFGIDPSWSNEELQKYFRSDNVQWYSDDTAPGGYAIQIDGNVNVGGDYRSGFPYIPIDDDDQFFEEMWIRTHDGSQNHYAGSIQYDKDFGTPTGWPGSYGYELMSNTTINSTSWTRRTATLGPNHSSSYSMGSFRSDSTGYPGRRKYWTPQALFNYINNSGTRRCYISGWAVYRRRSRGNTHFASISADSNKGFRIPHPLTSKRDKYDLFHNALEGPKMDLIYRGKVNLVGGSSTVNLDTASEMTEGTFVLLNHNVQCFTSNESGWTPVKGSVSGNILTITAQDNTSTDTIAWMVVGERHDDCAKSSEFTDSTGKLVVELRKDQQYVGISSATLTAPPFVP